MKDVVIFWAQVEAIGLFAVPIAAFLFARLPGGGLALARPLGLLLAAYPAWLLASLRLAPYGRITGWFGVALLAAVGTVLWLRRRPWSAQTVNTPRLRLWLIGEALFTVGFLGWALMRSYAPDVWQTEKPMDMAFINAINRSPWFPPHDPWLSGATINYYYFGHYLMAFLIRLTGLDPSVGFNLGVALFYGLSLSSVFAVASAVYLAARRDADAPTTPAAVAGLAAAGLAMLLGNLAGGVQWLLNPTALVSYDWWSPSRVIANTANEFPFFSFLLGDLHAHVMAAPFSLTSLAFALQLALAGPRGLWRGSALAELLIVALLVGSLYAINTLDYPTQLGILLLSLVLWLTRPGAKQRWMPAGAWAGILISASAVLFFPFILHFSPPSAGLGLVRQHAAFSQFLHDSLLIYGLTFAVLAVAFVHGFREQGWIGRYLVWNGVAGLIFLVLLAPAHLTGLVLVAALAGFAVFMSLKRPAPQPYRFLWCLIAGGIVLAYIGELVFVRDVFAGTPSYRFNTIFKFGYQAWFWLAIAAGVTAIWSRSWMRIDARRLWWAAVAVLVAAAAVYPLAGTYSRETRFAARPTLNGLGWLEGRAPGDLKAIYWLQTHVGGDPVTLEAAGPDFDPIGHARVSTFTGLPTVLGWAGHEIQWGHVSGSRGRDIQRIYASTDLAEARSMLAQYGVRYVFVGSLERSDYPAAGLEKFAELGTPVYSADGTIVYEISG